MPKEANTDYNVALKGQAFLCLHKFIFEPGAATKCYHLVLPYHRLFPSIIYKIIVSVFPYTTANCGYRVGGFVKMLALGRSAMVNPHRSSRS